MNAARKKRARTNHNKEKTMRRIQTPTVKKLTLAITSIALGLTLISCAPPTPPDECRLECLQEHRDGDLDDLLECDASCPSQN